MKTPALIKAANLGDLAIFFRGSKSAFGDSYFSAPLHPLTVQKRGFWLVFLIELK